MPRSGSKFRTEVKEYHSQTGLTSIYRERLRSESEGCERDIGNWSACIISRLCVVGPRPDNLDWARQLVADPAIHSAIRVLIVQTISLERHSARDLTRLLFTLGSVRLRHTRGGCDSVNGSTRDSRPGRVCEGRSGVVRA